MRDARRPFSVGTSPSKKPSSASTPRSACRRRRHSPSLRCASCSETPMLGEKGTLAARQLVNLLLPDPELLLELAKRVTADIPSDHAPPPAAAPTLPAIPVGPTHRHH